jgi:hypothetical protein
MGVIRSLGVLLKQQIRVLYRPRDAFLALNETSIVHVALVFSILLFLTGLVAEIIPLAYLGWVTPDNTGYYLMKVAGFYLWGMVGVVFLSVLFHIPAMILGGKNRFLRTLGVAMYAVTPFFLAYWISFALQAFLPVDIRGILLIIAFIWSFVLMRMGLAGAQDLVHRRTALTATTLGIALFIVFAVLALFLIMVTQNFFWEKPYPDAGNICNDSSECHGACLGSYVMSSGPQVLPQNSQITGTCSSSSSWRGCFCTLNRRQNETEPEQYDRVRSCMCVD